MARQRIIHPEFWTSEDMIPLSPIARLLFIGIWTFADDDGRIPFKVISLKCQIFPMDNIDVVPLVEELLSIGVVTEYSFEGDKYLVVKSWSKHQKIKYPTYKYPTSEGTIKHFDRISKQHSIMKFGEKLPTSNQQVKNMSPTGIEHVQDELPTSEERVPPKLRETKLRETKLREESVVVLESEAEKSTHTQTSANAREPINVHEVIEHAEEHYKDMGVRPSTCKEFFDKWSACGWLDSTLKPFNWKMKFSYFVKGEDKSKIVAPKKDEFVPLATDHFKSPKHTDEELEAFEKGAKSITLPWSKAE